MSTESISVGDELDYRFSWRGESPGPWLEDGESITAATASVTGPLQVMSIQLAGDDVIVWLTTTEAAASGRKGRLTVQIETSNSPKRVKSSVVDIVVD